MFGVSLATLGIARNSLNSRTMRSSFSIRYSRTACATCAGDGGEAFCPAARQGERRAASVAMILFKVFLPLRFLATIRIREDFKRRQFFACRPEIGRASCRERV